MKCVKQFYRSFLAPKPGKRSSDGNTLQAQAPKKIKIEEESKKSPNKDEKETKVETKEEIKNEVKSEKDDESMSPVKVSKSNKNRIVSDSEDDSPVKSKPKQAFPIFDKSPAKKLKTEVSPKTSPKSTDSAKKSKVEKTPNSDKSLKAQKNSPKKSPKEESPKPSTSKETSPKSSTSADTPKPKPKNPFQNFFSPKAGGLKENTTAEDGKDYAVKVKKLQYHPVDDAFWKKGEKTPYLALAKTLVAIEETSGRLRTIEILSNYFRSVMVLNPDDLLASVYMILNR